MSLYSTNFFTGPLASSFATLYTVPTAHTVVIRDIELVNETSGDVSASIYVGVAGSQGTLIQQPALPPNQPLQWQGRVVIPGGSTIDSYCSVGADVFVIVSGYLLN